MVNRFNTSIQGYNKEEVNEFVKEVIKEYESMLNKLKSSCAEIEKLQGDLKYYKEIEDTLNRAMIVAQESAESVKRNAYNESRSIVEDAKRNASKVINNALVKAERIETEAETLRRKVNFYKKRFKLLVEEHLDEIEGLEEFNDRL